MPDDALFVPEKFRGGDYGFQTTHWSVVLDAGQGDSTQARQALEQLCKTYWFPLYAYVRRSGHNPDEAQDLTQDFFLRLLEKESFTRADSSRGKFRTFLLSSLKNFLINEWQKGHAIKRGGQLSFVPLEQDEAERLYQAEPASDITPDLLLEKRWAVTVVERAQDRLRQEYSAAAKLELFEQLKDCVWGCGSAPYSALAQRLNTTEGALRVAAHRMKDRFRLLVREEVAHTTADPADVDAELRHLISLLRA